MKLDRNPILIRLPNPSMGETGDGDDEAENWAWAWAGAELEESGNIFATQ